jgi:hypothetical protein
MYMVPAGGLCVAFPAYHNSATADSKLLALSLDALTLRYYVRAARVCVRALPRCLCSCVCCTVV